MDTALPSEDRLSIDDLYSHVALALGAGDADAWTSCFVPDGVFAPSVGFGAGQEFRGTDQLRAFIAEVIRRGPTRLWTTGLVVEVDHDDATATCYGAVLGGKPPPLTLVGTVVYYDTLARIDGTWRFRSRRPVSDALV